MSEEKQQPEDRGSGFVTMVLDHGTGNARLGYDNVTPREMLALANVLRNVAASLLQDEERQKMRDEIKRELEQGNSPPKE